MSESPTSRIVACENCRWWKHEPEFGIENVADYTASCTHSGPPCPECCAKWENGEDTIWSQFDLDRGVMRGFGRCSRFPRHERRAAKDYCGEHKDV